MAIDIVTVTVITMISHDMSTRCPSEKSYSYEMLLLVHLLISTLIQLSHTKHHLANSGALSVTTIVRDPHEVGDSHQVACTVPERPTKDVGGSESSGGYPFTAGCFISWKLPR